MVLSKKVDGLRRSTLDLFKVFLNSTNLFLALEKFGSNWIKV
jgi:hypothetical protein